LLPSHFSLLSVSLRRPLPNDPIDSHSESPTRFL
jgi:hypothetical protein